MNLRHKLIFFRRYPLLLIGMAFLAGQLAIGVYVISFGWRHPEGNWFYSIGAAIFILSCGSLFVKSRFVFQLLNILIFFVLGTYSQIAVFPKIHSTQSEISALFKVVSKPKRRQTHLVTFSANLLDENFNTVQTVRFSATELPWRNITGVRQNDLFYAKAKCRDFNAPKNLFSFEYSQFRKNINSSCRITFAEHYWDKQRRPSLLQKLQNAMPELNDYRLEYGLLLSLIIGIDTELPVQLEKSFKRTGLTHLLVFSGAQTSLIYMSIVFSLRFVFSVIGYYRYIVSTVLIELAIALIGTIFICTIIGFDSATMRAVIACTLVAFASIKETNQGMLYRMFLSLVILAIIWPGSFLEPGVQLTYAALTGIWWGLRFRSKLIAYFQMSFAITILTNCVTYFWFKSISLMGMILNPLIAPSVSLFSVYAGIPAILLVATKNETARIIAAPVFWCLSHLESFVFWCSRFEWAYFEF